jgi:hypothetical protein
MGQSAEDLRERVQWTFPIVFDAHDPGIVYTGTQSVWKTTTSGENWTEISPDLSVADPATMGPSGGPITRDQTGVETYATVFALAPSPHDPEVMWAGSDDGRVHITRSLRADSPEWEDITPPDAPEFVRINTIEASPHTPGKAYVAGIRYLVEDDRSPYVWKTEDYGETWTTIVTGIPGDDFIRAVREDPVRPGLLFAASERTVYVSWDDGARWQPLGLNLPTVQVSDLVVEDHDLVIGTHGRSFWILYDMDPLRQLGPETSTDEMILYDPRDPIRGFDGNIDVYYYLPEDADEVSLEFLDDAGEVVRSFTGTRPQETEGDEEGDDEADEDDGPSPEVDAGSHRFGWNLRHPGYTDFEDRIFWAAGNVGPEALPGSYTVRLTVDGETAEHDFRIRMNPRAAEEGVTLADLEDRFELAMAIRDRVSVANEAVIRIRRIREQVDERMEEAPEGAIDEMATVVKDRLSDVEAEIYQVRNQSNQDPLNFPIKINNKLAALMFVVERAEDRPTAQSREVFTYLDGLLDAQLEELDQILSQELGRLNEILRDMELDPVATEDLVSEDR